jgi:hypothetical protein
MAARVRFKEVATSPDHEARGKLASAIAARDDLQRRVAGLEAAADSAMRENWELNRELETAQSRISEAEQRGKGRWDALRLPGRAAPKPGKRCTASRTRSKPWFAPGRSCRRN